jgi:protein-tyrosine phosphatase
MITSLALSCAYLLKKPSLLLKRPSGTLSPLSYLIFWPYLILNTVAFSLFCLFSREQAISEIVPGLYLGRQLWFFEAQQVSKIVSTLDLTAEFSEVGFIRRQTNYLSIPLLDKSIPTLKQLEVAVSWLTTQESQGAIFVHCALGHERSAIIVAAFLLKRGIVNDVNTAINLITSKRTGVYSYLSAKMVVEQLTRFCLLTTTS